MLSVFLTAGYPERNSTVPLVETVAAAGADFIELGIPFSDPMADGPTIQASSQTALENGMTVSLLLQQVAKVRDRTNIPIVLMGYLNPLLKYGLAALVRDAENAGADAFIIPDLIPEEYARFASAFETAAIGLNFLISPNTSRERIQMVDALTHDFVYCVSVTGVTGAHRGVADSTISFLQRVNQTVRRPCLAGFGISSPEDAAAISRNCHGVIVGSAIIRRMARNNESEKYLIRVGEFVSDLKEALRGA